MTRPAGALTQHQAPRPQAAGAEARKRDDPTPLPRKVDLKLSKTLAAYADGLRQDPDFAPVIHSDPKGFRSHLQRLISLQFPLRRGRPTDPLLDAACRMIEQGKKVPEVLRSQIANFDKLDPYTRLLMSKGMHAAFRRRRRGLKKRPGLEGRKIPPISGV